jgi:hypothetical protein
VIRETGTDGSRRHLVVSVSVAPPETDREEREQ